MSNSDFQDRLARISAKAPAPAPTTRVQRLGYGNLVIGAVAMSVGVHMLRSANGSYDAIRDQYGIPAALGLALGGVVVLIFGMVYLFKAVRRGDAAPAAHALRAPIRTSAGARAFFSLLGLGLGAVACLYMFLGNAGRQLGVTGQVDQATANEIAMGSTLMAFLLVGLALMIGFIGLFVRRLPLLRVPVFFLLGGMLLYVGFQTFRIHPSDWPVFMASFTSAFTDGEAP
jgi:hypothetical protein